MQYAHNGYVYCMLLARGLSTYFPNDHDAEILISGGGDGTIKLWSLNGSAHGGIDNPETLAQGDESILALALDSTVLYAGLLEGDVNVWDLDARQMIRRVKAHASDVLTLTVGQGLIFSASANGNAKVNFSLAVTHNISLLTVY